jgi:hypothetical protein
LPPSHRISTTSSTLELSFEIKQIQTPINTPLLLNDEPQVVSPENNWSERFWNGRYQG